jgi:hypothetical protein
MKRTQKDEQYKRKERKFKEFVFMEFLGAFFGVFDFEVSVYSLSVCVLMSRGAGVLVPKAKSLFSLSVCLTNEKCIREREREKVLEIRVCLFVCVGSCAREKVGCTSFSHIPTYARD